MYLPSGLTAKGLDANLTTSTEDLRERDLRVQLGTKHSLNNGNENYN